jgi:hypothetical protein
VENAAPVARFRPDPRFTVAAGAGALGAAAAFAVSNDGPSRLFAAVVFCFLFVYVTTDVVFSPRLIVTPAGLTICSPLTRATLPWVEVADVRVDRRLRLGLRTNTLEIDAGRTLAVLSRRALGAEPEAAADLINSFRPPGPRATSGPRFD